MSLLIGEAYATFYFAKSRQEIRKKKPVSWRQEKEALPRGTRNKIEILLRGEKDLPGQFCRDGLRN